MASTNRKDKNQEFKEPMVVFPLKQYESLMEYIEDMEDRLAISERKTEPIIGQEQVEKLFMDKFGKQ